MIQRSLQITAKTDTPRSFGDYETMVDTTLCVPEIVS